MFALKWSVDARQSLCRSYICKEIERLSQNDVSRLVPLTDWSSGWTLEGKT
jgi:hypothetical protein